MDRIKVVWLCHFSNESVHNSLVLGNTWLKSALRTVLRKPVNTKVSDYAVWITNGIREFEKIQDVELHIVSPYPYLKNQIQEFEKNGIYYHFFHNEDEDIIKRFIIFGKKDYRKNRRIISKLIKKIRPDIIHLFGAENPHYSLALLDVPSTIPTIVQLQTLLNDPIIPIAFPNIDHYLLDVEKKVICKATFVGTQVVKFREIIKKDVCPSVIYVNTNLALAEPINKETADKEFDFVYFASNIKKAADLAIEAFALARQKVPNITLDIVGGFDSDYRASLDSRILELGLAGAITFEGSLLTHDDVIRQIRKSRFALLPLRADITSGTIREAMSNGLPVITTDTGELGTQKLNLKCQNVLISPVGDHNALADNMIRLLSDKSLADTLRQNAYQTMSVVKSNEAIIQNYVKVYKVCINNIKNSVLLPADVIDI